MYVYIDWVHWNVHMFEYEFGSLSL